MSPNVAETVGGGTLLMLPGGPPPKVLVSSSCQLVAAGDRKPPALSRWCTIIAIVRYRHSLTPNLFNRRLSSFAIVICLFLISDDTLIDF